MSVKTSPLGAFGNKSRLWQELGKSTGEMGRCEKQIVEAWTERNRVYLNQTLQAQSRAGNKNSGLETLWGVLSDESSSLGGPKNIPLLAL